jgi:hypothetical protein
MLEIKTGGLGLSIRTANFDFQHGRLILKPKPLVFISSMHGRPNR